MDLWSVSYDVAGRGLRWIWTAIVDFRVSVGLRLLGFRLFLLVKRLEDIVGSEQLEPFVLTGSPVAVGSQVPPTNDASVNLLMWLQSGKKHAITQNSKLAIQNNKLLKVLVCLILDGAMVVFIYLEVVVGKLKPATQGMPARSPSQFPPMALY